MKSILRVINNIKKSPLKSFLTVFTVALGVGVLIIALSISQFFSHVLKTELEQGGLLISVTNGEYSESGELEMTRPSQLDEKAADILSTDISGLTSITLLARPFWQEIKVNTKQHQIRNIAAVNQDYDEITDMEIIAGSFFDEEDVEKGAKKAVISESLAILLYGSVENALDRTFRPPAMTMRMPGRGPGSREVRQSPSYTISGVYGDFSELKRKAYGLGDLLVPYTSILFSDMNAQMARMALGSTYLLKVQGQDFSTVEAQIRTALTAQYGDDVNLYIWEGASNGEDSVLKETRQSIFTFSIVVNLLGFLLLITGSIGILSIMLVEVLGKSRNIAIERALGAAKINIIKEYMSYSVVITALSVITGIILSVIFSGPIRSVVLPIVSDIGNVSSQFLYPGAIAISAVSALIIGGLFGTFPVFSVLKNNIAEDIKEG